MRRLWGLAVNLALAAGVTIVGLVGIEAYLRWVKAFEAPAAPGCYDFSENPRLMYEMKPNCVDGGSGVTNAWGMRDNDTDPLAPGIRIAALGDSITYGPGRPIEGTWPKIVQQLSARAGKPATVLNFAVQGYSTVQEVETLRTKGLQFQPQGVLLQYFMNDEDVYTTFFDAMIDDLRQRHLEGYLSALDLRHGWLVRRVLLSRTAIAIRVALDRLELTMTPTGDPHHNVITDYYKEHSPVREGLTALREIANANGLRVLVLIFPHAYGAFGLPGMEAYPKSWVFDNAHVITLCHELGLDCVDIAERMHSYPRLREIPGHKIFGDGCCHLRALGHKTMAWVVYREIAARGWLDRRD
jgi:hypothetical protein